MARRIATNTRVDTDALLDFVRPRHRMLVITRRGDGRTWGPVATGGFPERLA